MSEISYKDMKPEEEEQEDEETPPPDQPPLNQPQQQEQQPSLQQQPPQQLPSTSKEEHLKQIMREDSPVYTSSSDVMHLLDEENTNDYFRVRTLFSKVVGSKAGTSVERPREQLLGKLKAVLHLEPEEKLIPFVIPKLRNTSSAKAPPTAATTATAAPTDKSSLDKFRNTGIGGIGEWVKELANATNMLPNRWMSDTSSSLSSPESITSSTVPSPAPSTVRHVQGGSGSGPSVRASATAQTTAGSSAPNTCSNSPHPKTPQSMRSRHQSGCSQSSGLLQQINIGIVRNIPTRSATSVRARVATRARRNWNNLRGAIDTSRRSIRRYTRILSRSFASLDITFRR